MKQLFATRQFICHVVIIFETQRVSWKLFNTTTRVKCSSLHKDMLNEQMSGDDAAVVMVAAVFAEQRRRMSKLLEDPKNLNSSKNFYFSSGRHA